MFLRTEITSYILKISSFLIHNRSSSIACWLNSGLILVIILRLSLWVLVFLVFFYISYCSHYLRALWQFHEASDWDFEPLTPVVTTHGTFLSPPIICASLHPPHVVVLSEAQERLEWEKWWLGRDTLHRKNKTQTFFQSIWFLPSWCH